MFFCKLCNASFAAAVQLGGHTSKQHPGTSKNYNKKLQIREANTTNRVFLKKAKEWILEHTLLDLRKDRDKVTKVKNILIAGGTPTLDSNQRIKAARE